MATLTFSTNSDNTSDATSKAFFKAVSDALRSIPDLTLAADRAKDNLTTTNWSSFMDFTDKSATGVTTTAGGTAVTGTFDTALAQTDVGRPVRIPGAGSGGSTYYGRIETVTGAGAFTVPATNPTATAVGGSGTAVVGPNKSTVTQGYEIYYFNDAAQATCPFYIKVRYLVSTTPRFSFTFGRGTDGSGNLANPTTSTMEHLSASNGTTPYLQYMSHGPGRFSFHWRLVDGTIKGVISIARSVDANGAATDDYVALDYLAFAEGSHRHLLLNKYGGWYPDAGSGASGNSTPVPQGQTTANYNGNVGVFPCRPYRGRADNPNMGGCIYLSADYPVALTTFNVTMYGVARTFLALGALYVNPNANANAQFAMRYE
jgi:hypothetical protein